LLVGQFDVVFLEQLDQVVVLGLLHQEPVDLEERLVEAELQVLDVAEDGADDLLLDGAGQDDGRLQEGVGDQVVVAALGGLILEAEKLDEHVGVADGRVVDLLAGGLEFGGEQPEGVLAVEEGRVAELEAVLDAAGLPRHDLAGLDLGRGQGLDGGLVRSPPGASGSGSRWRSPG
jgi:hypothetical protein